MKENELAIQNGLRTEIAENFMNNLKGLFTESYIEVPESKVDLVDDLSDQVAELEEQLNKQTEQSMDQALELEYLKRESVIREAAKGLAETQVEKLVDLSENVDFEDEESFKNKIETLKENYFKTFKNFPSEITILTYDAIGLIYYFWKKNGKINSVNDFTFKGKIKGKIGKFSFNNKKIIQDLNIYKVENNKFIKF